ncbi:MAG: hypothetical protein HDS83_04460 [Bacteroidales bacterium]|nr:hypothetical protein [Bacteroidales bacterium]
MKKYLSSLSLFFICFNSYAQAWVMDEIAQEAEETEPITFFQISIFFVLCIIIWLGIKSYRYLKASDKIKYLQIRKKTIIICLLILLLSPISILTYFDIKNSILESDAKKVLNNIIDNTDTYIQLKDKLFAIFDEILPCDNQTPNNEIMKDMFYKYNFENRITPYNGIYRCFNINTSGCWVIFAGDAKAKGFSSEDNPSLFHGWIRPYRIRYYSPYNINPQYDTDRVFPNFVKTFIENHNAKLNDNIVSISYLPLNDYYAITPIPGGEEMWNKNKLYDESSIAFERSYEYKTIDYGNFDITYCISRPGKFGVCEKLMTGHFLGKRYFDKIHAVKCYNILEKFIIIWLFILCSITIIFYFSNPIRKSKFLKNSI